MATLEAGKEVAGENGPPCLLLFLSGKKVFPRDPSREFLSDFTAQALPQDQVTSVSIVESPSWLVIPDPVLHCGGAEGFPWFWLVRGSRQLWEMSQPVVRFRFALSALLGADECTRFSQWSPGFPQPSC